MKARTFSGDKDRLNNAKVAQLVEHDLAKVGVAGSNPVFSSIFFGLQFCWTYIIRSFVSDLSYNVCPNGGTGRHAGLKILCTYVRVGSTPTSGTIFIKKYVQLLSSFWTL